MTSMSDGGGEIWRLIRSGPARGAENMALDEALLESVAAGDVPPTVRLYAWDPPCLSLGVVQKLESVDLERLERLGWDLVRRPTGGRAILHTDELTYSVVGLEDHPILRGGVLESYRRLSSALVRGLENLGLQVEVQPETPVSDRERADPICFQVPSSHEITIQGKKLLGSAQLRRGRAILQHGSLPLAGDIGRICQALRFDDDHDRRRASERLRNRATTLEALAGRDVAWEEAAAALEKGFEHALGIHFRVGDPSEAERRMAQGLVTRRYDLQTWTARA